MTWDLAHSNVKSWWFWLSPLLSDKLIGSAYGEEQGVAEFTRHTQHALCQEACVHDRGVLVECQLRWWGDAYWLSEMGSDRKGIGHPGQNSRSCFSLKKTLDRDSPIKNVWSQDFRLLYEMFDSQAKADNKIILLWREVCSSIIVIKFGEVYKNR